MIISKKKYMVSWCIITLIYLIIGGTFAFWNRDLRIENKRLKENQVIIYRVDNAGAAMIGKITEKKVIQGHYTVTAGAYGKFLVTKEQYESLKVGDGIPEFLKGRGRQ